MTIGERAVITATHALCDQVLTLLQTRGVVAPEDTAVLIRAAAMLAETRERLAAQLRTGAIVVTDPMGLREPSVH